MRLCHHEGFEDDLSLPVDGGHEVAVLADINADVGAHFFIYQVVSAQ
jgi:hypothetical protein